MLFVDRRELVASIEKALDSLQQHSFALEFESFRDMYKKLHIMLDFAILETDKDEA